MFKQTYLASAVFMALTSHALYAADAEVADEQAQAAVAEQPAEQPKAAEDENMEVIQVVGIRSSLNKSVNLKRQNVQVVDAIVAEDVGKFPDNNVVEALQRVTGVQVTDRGAGEVNTVSIRGLTDVTTTVNGRKIFTSTGREVAIADVPAALLGSVEVFKTRSSSQVASGIAGQIDIRTHRPFDFDGSKVSVAAKGVYSDQPDKVDPAFSALLSNRWDTDIGEVGALLNISYIRTNYNDQSVAPGASLPYSAETGTEISDDYWTRGLAHGMDTNYGATTSDGTPYLLMRDAVFQNSNTGERERPALNLSLQWAPNDTSEYLFEAFYNGYRNDNDNMMLFSNVNSAANWDQVIDDGIELYDGTNVVKSRTSYNVGGFSSADHTHAETDSYVFALGGKWEIDNLTLKSEVVYQTSTYESQFFAMRGISSDSSRAFYGVDIDYNASHGGVPAWGYLDNPNTPDIDESDITQLALWQTADLYDSGTKDEGDSISWTFDGDYYLDWGIFTKMKFGLRYEDRTAKHSLYDAGALSTNIAYTDLDPDMFNTVTGFFEGRGDVPTSWVLPRGGYLYSHRSEIEELYGANPQALAMYTNYDIDETSYAAYIQSDFETDLFGKRLDGQIGFRYEHSKADMDFGERKQYEDPVDGQLYYIDPTSGENSSSKLLPSLMLRYWLTDDFVARLAYSETIRLPAYADLSTAVGYTEDLTDLGFGQATSGNPDLKPTTSKNYDFSLEYYFGSGSSVYGTYFRRDIDGFVFSSSRMITREVDGENNRYILSQPANTSNGKLTGYELGTVYFPENLPSFLDGLGTQLSATFLDSEQDIPEFDQTTGEETSTTQRDMFGVSKKSFSGVLIYDKEVFSARLSYTWRDKFLNSYDAASFAMPRGIYRKPEKSLDFQMSYNVTDDLVVTFDATNILDDIYQEYYEDSVLFNRTNNIYTRTYALGMRYSF